MTEKTKHLIELVQGKTVLKDAPTRRDTILYVYNIDIDDPNTKEWDKYFVKKKFTSLIRDVRKKERDAVADPYMLHSHNNYQFYMVRDEETKKWHCVHIIQEVNGHYLLKWGRQQEKYYKTMMETTEEVSTIAELSEETRAELRKNEIKENWKRRLVKQHCTPKRIRNRIAELRKKSKIVGDYKPNMKGIEYEFRENASEVKATNATLTLLLFAEDNITGPVRAYLNDKQITESMLEQIIMCDYRKVDYRRPEPDVIDVEEWRKKISMPNFTRNHT